MADRQKILEALQKMDVNNDNHWTMNGDAKLDTIKFLSGGEGVSREELLAIAPTFNREAMRAYLAGEQVKTETGNGGQAANVVQTGAGSGVGEGTIKPPESKTPTVDDGAVDREAEVEALAAEVDRANEEIQQCQRIQGEMSNRIAELQKKTQIAQSKLNKISPPPSNMDAIQAYLASQKKLTAMRGEARRVVSESGVNLSGLQKSLQPSALEQSLRNRPRQKR